MREPSSSAFVIAKSRRPNTSDMPNRTASRGTSPEGVGKRLSRWFIATALGAASCLLAANAAFAAFGAQIIVGNVKVSSIFRGAYGPAYVMFTPANLPGCNSNAGGYLSSMWSEAISWPADPAAPKDQLALLALAKATDATVEVRYRVNSLGTGWDRCAIDAIWVQ